MTVVQWLEVQEVYIFSPGWTDSVAWPHYVSSDSVATMAKYHSLRGLNKSNLFSPSAGGWEVQDHVTSQFTFTWELSSWLADSSTLCPRLAFPRCTHVEREKDRSLFFLFWGHQSYQRRVLPWWPHLTLITSYKPCVPMQSHWGLGLPSFDFWPKSLTFCQFHQVSPIFPTNPFSISVNQSYFLLLATTIPDW